MKRRTEDGRSVITQLSRGHARDAPSSLARISRACSTRGVRRLLLVGFTVSLTLSCGGVASTSLGDAGAGDSRSSDSSASDAAADSTGSDASCTGAVVCACRTGCTCPVPVCENGQWVCPAPVCTVDAGSSDAGFACGPSLTCPTATELCTVTSGGPPPPPDAAPFVAYACVAYPAACQADHSCGCVRTNDPCMGCPQVACMMDSSGGVIVSCGCP